MSEKPQNQISLIRQKEGTTKPFWKLVKVQGKLALKEPFGIIFGIGLPVFLLMIFGNIPSIRSFFVIYVPTLMATVLIMIGLIGLPIPIVRDREMGWLRRISTTPVSPARLLAAQIAINLVLTAIAQMILVIGGVFLFNVGSSIEIPGFLLSIVLLAFAMFSLGLVVAAVAPSQGAANGIAMGLLYPMLFFAGVYVPIQYLPSSFQILASVTPVGAAVSALDSSLQGVFPSVQPLVVMVFYAVVLGFLAVRYFRWE